MDVQGNRYCLGLVIAIIISMSLSAAKKPETGTPLLPVTVSGVEFQLVRIPAGEFQMGSQNQSEETEIPRHLVRLRTLILLVEEPFTTEGTEDTEENQTNRGSRLGNNSRSTQPFVADSALRW